MKRFIILLSIFALVVVAFSYRTIPQVYMILPTAADKPNYEDDRLRSNFVGRLYIDDIGIDVALYHSIMQYVVDDSDSAAYFDLYPWKGHMVIADHSTQGFATLPTAEIGMVARIEMADGTVVYYECVDAFDGYNKGSYISDINGKIVMHRADILMYTCLDYYKGVRVVLWNKIEDIE